MSDYRVAVAGVSDTHIDVLGVCITGHCITGHVTGARVTTGAPVT